jgi:hypothetical protein
MSRSLTLDDIVDLRAYEREREAFRAHVVEVKKRRRVSVGPVVTLVFENRDTVRFQIQEMARAERMLTDEAIETELRIYNPLIPEPGELSATLFIELTSRDEMETWLPRLVGVESAAYVRVGDEVVGCTPDPEHTARLTREEITSSVHYVRFALTPTQVEAFATAEIAVGLGHPSYDFETILAEASRAELLGDLRHDPA